METTSIGRREMLRNAGAVGVTGFGLVVAGCIGGDDGDATVSVSTHDDLGEILTDDEGLTLYMFDPDEQGESTCYDSCADAWPPLVVEDEDTVEPDTDVSAELGTVERDDGSPQVTADGWPLYYFAGDDEPGDVAGQGVNDVWWVLRSDGSVLREDAQASADQDSTPEDDTSTSEADDTPTPEADDTPTSEADDTPTPEADDAGSDDGESDYGGSDYGY